MNYFKTTLTSLIFLMYFGCNIDDSKTHKELIKDDFKVITGYTDDNKRFLTIHEKFHTAYHNLYKIIDDNNNGSFDREEIDMAIMPNVKQYLNPDSLNALYGETRGKNE